MWTHWRKPCCRLSATTRDRSVGVCWPWPRELRWCVCVRVPDPLLDFCSQTEPLRQADAFRRGWKCRNSWADSTLSVIQMWFLGFNADLSYFLKGKINFSVTYWINKLKLKYLNLIEYEFSGCESRYIKRTWNLSTNHEATRLICITV